MKYIFYVLPFLISVLVVYTKGKIVRAQSGQKYAYRELLLDVVKVIIVTAIAVLANLLYGKEIRGWAVVIDVLMLFMYLLPLLQKNYDYAERKATMGLMTSIIICICLCITLIRMLLGSYDSSDNTIAVCFFKCVTYFVISMWCCFTAQEKTIWGKMKALFLTLVEIFKQSRLNTLDYYAIAIFTLFIFWGYRDYFSPAGLFGMHDFINGRKCKGILYIIWGNACLLLKNYVYDLGNLACTVYLFVAIIDLLVQLLKSRKAKNQKNNLMKGDSHGI